MKAILCETGLAFNKDDYVKLYGNNMFLKLKKKFEVRTVDRITKMPRITKLYKLINCETFTVIEFPRFAIRRLYSDEPNAFSPITHIEYQLPKHPKLESINYIGKSNPNQQVIVDHVVKSFNEAENICGMTIKVAAGLGKSFIAKDIINRMKLKTLIVVPNTYLLNQWVVLLTQYFPNTTIGQLYGKCKKDGDIIVGIINTVSDLISYEHIEKIPVESDSKRQKFKKIKTIIQVDDILKNIGLSIFDESHMYVSKEFKKVFRRIWSRYTIGLSATPDIREDKLDIIHRMWLGPIMDANTLEGFNPIQDSFTAQVNIIDYYALNKDCKFNVRDNGIIDYPSIVESIINDENRNDVIIDQIMHLSTKGLYTFVFSDRRCHLEHLYNLLEQKISDQPLALELPELGKKVILYGGSDDDTISKAKQISTVVFTTYSYSSTGVSITKMNGLILATPRKSNITQIIGRVFRLGSDMNIKRMIVDISDAKLPLKAQLAERKKSYKERECEIKKISIYAAEPAVATTT